MESWTAAFDAADRLTNKQITNGDEYHFTYSPSRDCIALQLNNTVETRVYGPSHELVSTSQGPPESNMTVQHDIKGNLKRDQNQVDFAWDFDNDLRSSSDVVNNKSSSYQYNVFGELVWSNASNGAATDVATIYISDLVKITAGVQLNIVIGQYGSPLFFSTNDESWRTFTVTDAFERPSHLVDQLGISTHVKWGIDNRIDLSGAVPPTINAWADSQPVSCDSGAVPGVSLSTAMRFGGANRTLAAYSTDKGLRSTAWHCENASGRISAHSDLPCTCGSRETVGIEWYEEVSKGWELGGELGIGGNFRGWPIEGSIHLIFSNVSTTGMARSHTFGCELDNCPNDCRCDCNRNQLWRPYVEVVFDACRRFDYWFVVWCPPNPYHLRSYPEYVGGHFDYEYRFKSSNPQQNLISDTGSCDCNFKSR